MNVGQRRLLTTGSGALAVVLLGAVTALAMAFTPGKEASPELILEAALTEAPLDIGGYPPDPLLRHGRG